MIAGHYRDLPTIKFRSDLQEEKVLEHFNEMSLATIDFNTFHTKTRTQQSIKISQNKVLIAPPTT